MSAPERDEWRDKIRDEIAGWPIGSGYYGTSVGVDEAGEIAAALLPVVREIADQRAAEELERLADERVWTTQHDNEVVSARDLYEQVARLRGELEPVVFDDFPPDDAAVLAPTEPTSEGTTR